MKYDTEEALEHALFALPLEETPRGLRESILAATVYRPPSVLKLWETWAFGAAAGVLAWLVIDIVLGGAGRFVGALDAIGAFVLGAISDPATLLWIALGLAAAMWLSLANFGTMTVPLRIRRR